MFSESRKAVLVLFVGFVSAALILSLIPGKSQAVLNQGDLECIGIPCPCKMGPGPKGPCAHPGPGVIGCPCKDITSGFTTMGKCVAPMNCKGNSTSDGKSLGDLKGIMDLAKGLMDLLKPKEKGGGGGDQGMPPGGYGGLTSLYPPCVVNPATGTLSPIPCVKSDGSIAYDASGGSGVLDYFDDSGDDSTSLLDLLNGDDGESEGEGDGEINPEDGGTEGEVAPETPGDPSSLTPSQSGDILLGDGGVTVIANSRDGNSEVAGFYGVPSRSRLQSQSILGRLCVSRPWAGGFLEAIIPASFFDSMCRVAGYQVGPISFTETSGTSGTSGTFVAPPETPDAPPPPVQIGIPKVDVWAEPDRVRLGTRTYIFWDAENVSSCETLGPSFEQRSFSGGASTVPITDASTYVMTCFTADGEEIIDEVTVYLAI